MFLRENLQKRPAQEGRNKRHAQICMMEMLSKQGTCFVRKSSASRFGQKNTLCIGHLQIYILSNPLGIFLSGP
jgi:hypothetical protein